ncbi:MAG TPA: FIST N-terminal domain-containing protein [Nannocystis sp.]
MNGQDLAAGVGWNGDPDSFAAGATAGRAALEQARSHAPVDPVAAIVYSTVLYDQEAVLRGVRSVLPGARIVGASTQDISRTGDVESGDRVVGVAVLGGSGITARSAYAPNVSKDPANAARMLAEQLGPPPEPDGPPLLLWYDPLTGINVDTLIAGLRAAGYTRILGGGAGQPWGPVYRTYQYFEGRVTRDSAVVLRLGGAVDFVHDLTHGTDTLGLELEVTAAEGNVISAIDGRPALDVWREQLGLGDEDILDIEATAAWALGVSVTMEPGHDYEGPITRSVFGFRTKTREVVLQAPIPAGTQVQVCHRTPEAVFDRAAVMATRLHTRLAGRSPVLALSFECAARARPFLGEELTRREIGRMQAILGEDLPWLGMYAWGEVAPVGPSTYFHNYTFPLAILCRRG